MPDILAWFYWFQEHWIASGLTASGVATVLWKAAGAMHRAYVRYRVNRLWPQFREALDEARTGCVTPHSIAFDDFARSMQGEPRSVLKGLWDGVAELPFAKKSGDGYILEAKPKERPDDMA